MSNKTSSYLVIAVIILAAIATLGIKGCIDKNRPQPISPTKTSIDTVNVREAANKKIIDSLLALASRYGSQKDSLVRVTERQSDIITLGNVKINALAKEYNLYRKYADTASALAACDSLSGEVGKLTNEVAIYQLNNRALQSQNDSIIGANSLLIARMDFNYSALREQFDKVAGSSLALEKENTDLKRKVKKRVGIGPHVTVSYLNGKVVPVAGVGVHYSLIRF